MEKVKDNMNSGTEIKSFERELLDGFEAAKSGEKIKKSAPLRKLLVEIQNATSGEEGINVLANLSESGIEKPTRGQQAVEVLKCISEISHSCGHPIISTEAGPAYYNGKCWEHIRPRDFGYFLTVAAQLLGVKFHEAKQGKFVEEAARSFETFEYFGIEKPAHGVSLLNCANGTIEITAEGATLRPHRADDGLFYCLPYAYDPEATSPLFDAFLYRVCPREPDRLNLQEYVGYLFAPWMHQEKVLYMYGATGSNGKTTFLDIITDMLGEDAVTRCPFSTLTSNTNDGSAARLSLSGKILNACGETDRRIKGGQSWFKTLVSRTAFDERPPYGKTTIRVEDYACMMFCANNLPIFVESDGKGQGSGTAEARRFLFINFDVEIPAKERDKMLRSKISASELPGVLNWAVRGLQRLARNDGHLTENPSSDAVTEQFLQEGNSVFAYLNEYGLKIPTIDNLRLPGKTVRMTLSEAYNDKAKYFPEDRMDPSARDIPNYCEYCRNEGRIAKAQGNFGRELENLGFRRTVYNGHKNVFVFRILDEEKIAQEKEKLFPAYS